MNWALFELQRVVFVAFLLALVISLEAIGFKFENKTSVFLVNPVCQDIFEQ
jgi:hypothetical protein